VGVTKSDFMRGMQCEKMLWLDRHRPEEKIIPPEVQARLDAGNDFGDSVMGIFGDYVETTAYKPDGKLDFKKMIETTRECIENRVGVICEGAFLWYGNYCAADILRLTVLGYELYEIKNSDSVKDQFVKDAAFQYFILKKCGVRVCKVFIGYNKNGDGVPVFQDVTDEARAYYRTIGDNIFRLNSVKFSKDEPCISTGTQCDYPYECWYKDYCKKEERLCVPGNCSEEHK